MRRTQLFAFLFAVAIFATISTWAWPSGESPNEVPWPADFGAFTSLEPIDTHAHAFKPDARFYDLLRKLHLHLVDIAVATNDDPRFPQLGNKIEALKTFVKASKGQAVLCTTFNPFKFSEANFTDEVNRQLNRDFAWGAVAVRIWKNVGMELRDQSGRFVMPDDPRLEPIYMNISQKGKTLIAHLAEPDSCWQPPNQTSPDSSYYSNHPEWYMYKQPDHPRKEIIIRARDHMLEQNPNLRVVGAHLGSLETNLDELGWRFDRYPNFAIDVAARTVYLTMEPREKARNFFIKYQDRIVYGTDLSFFVGQTTESAAKTWERQYATDWAFFSSGGMLEYRGRKVQGLALPQPVLRKLYHDNAAHWIHGVVSEASR